MTRNTNKGKFTDYSGTFVNEIEIISFSHRKYSKNSSTPIWLCKCYCGNEFYADVYAILSGGTKSCGCLKKETSIETLNKHRRKCELTPEEITKRKENQRKQRLYQIGNDEYEKLLLKQDNKCAICNRDRSEFTKNFAVDHDHITGKVRGLLCQDCNVSLGLLRDNINILQNAIVYLGGQN